MTAPRGDRRRLVSWPLLLACILAVTANGLAAGRRMPVRRQRALRASAHARRLTEREERRFEKGEPDADSPDRALRWRRLSMVDENGRIAPDAFANALAARRRNAEYSATLDRAAVAGINPSDWVSRGPQNVGGRTRALVIHPTNPNLMWAGSVSGGIWSTVNGGATWTPVNDFAPNLAIGSMAIDAANPSVLYAGTGEGFFNGDAIEGAGIFKSTDGGATWNQLPGTAGWTSVNRISIAPGNSSLLLAAVSGGIARSTDGGATWSIVKKAHASLFVAFNPSDATKAIAETIDHDSSISDDYHRALYSNDGGATWHRASGRLRRAKGFSARMELAYAPSSPNIVYAHLGQPDSLWRSTDGGASYALTASTSISPYNWYCNALWVSPTDSNFLVVGGIHLFKSSDGGASVQQISNGYILTDHPHPDQHVIVSSPGFDGVTNKTVFVCDDGGIFRTDNIFTADVFSGWVNVNAGYQTTQYYGADGNGPDNLIVGGLQDNGTLRLQTGTNASLMFGGDGGFAAIDPTNSQYCYGEYTNLTIHRSKDGGLSSNYIYEGISDAEMNANFIAPFILDPNESNRMLAGGASLWRSNDVRTAPTQPTWRAIRDPGSDLISAIAVAPGNSDLIWVAQNDGKIYKTTNGTAASPTWSPINNNVTRNPLPDRYPTRILIDPTNSNTVYVAFGGFSDGNLRRTTDGGKTWSDVTGSGPSGLPLAPIRGIARHPSNANMLYVGTEVGVFATEDGGATWTTSNRGPANVPVDELVFMHGSTNLLAATHGRGIWTIDVTASALTGNWDGR